MFKIANILTFYEGEIMTIAITTLIIISLIIWALFKEHNLFLLLAIILFVFYKCEGIKEIKLNNDNDKINIELDK